MRHRVFGNHLGRNTKQARALYRGLLLAFFERGRIETTQAKAKAIQVEIDKLINLAKKNTVASRRQVIKIFGGANILKKIFSDVALKYPRRNSGFSRIIKLGERFSDTAQKVILELVEADDHKSA